MCERSALTIYMSSLGF